MEIVKLEEVAEIIAGQSPPSETYNEIGDGLPFYQGKADFGIKHPKVRVWCTEPIKISKANDILISVRAPVGAVNINTEDSGIGRGLSAIRSKDIYFEYLYYYLKTEEKNISKLGVGSTFQSITQNDIKGLKIPLPSYADQIRIAQLLEKIESLIAERKKAIDLLDELVKSAFYWFFGDPVRNEKGWKKEAIGQYANSIVPGRDKPKSFTGEIRWITTDKLKDLQFVNKNDLNLGLTEEEIKEAKSKIIPSQSILMSCVGDLGIVSIVDFECVANQQLHSYQCGASLNNIFAMFCLSHSKSFMYKMASTTTVPYMNKTICNSIPIILPPLDLQNQFATIAQKIEVLKNEQEAQMQVMEELYASITQKVFAGGLDLSKIPVDKALLPKDIIITQPDMEEDGGEEEEEETISIIKREKTQKTAPTVSKMVDAFFEDVDILFNFEKIAKLVKNYFGQHYFNSEMLIEYLETTTKSKVFYHSSAEEKKNPKLSGIPDIYQFISTAVIGDNSFIKLEQVFYNAEAENIPGMSFTPNDLETLAGKAQKERSGIYFRIKDEVTPG